jgi:hypothetical protein
MTADADLPPTPEPAGVAGPASVDPGVTHHRGWRAAGLGIALAVLAMSTLAACGSSSGHPDAGGVGISATCTAVGAALSDGPDPDADPVGYAEAQIRPLRAIQTSDQALRVAIDNLAEAYARVFASNGTSSTASKAVAAAASKVNAICPGAAS